MDTQRFRALTAHDRALVAVAVLLDGREAPIYLERDAVNGPALSRAAADLASQDPDLRMALVGSLLRIAIEDLAG